MEVSFGKSENAAPVEQSAPVDSKLTCGGQVYDSPTAYPGPDAVPGVSVPTVRPPHALAPGGLVLGDKLPDFADIILPRINIVQGIGELKNTFPQGGIVFNQTNLIFQPPKIDKNTGNILEKGLPPVTMVVLGFRPTRFVEKVTGGVRGAICNTEAEVRAMGGTLDYSEWK